MDNTVRVRQFLRREPHERAHLILRFPPALRIFGYTLFHSIVADPEVVTEALDRPDSGLDAGCADCVDSAGLTRQDIAVDHDRTELMVTEGEVLVCHNGLDRLKMIVGIHKCDDDEAILIRVTVRHEDKERLQGVADWTLRLRRDNGPINGKTVTLGESGITFLPPSAVADEDVILPAGVKDILRRSFAFLDDPAPWPQTLQHRGVLLAGPPGVGKTLAARWLSAQLPVTTIWVPPGVLAGIGPAEIFRLASDCKPALLILEDLNGLEGPGDDPRVYGALLGHMDGFTDLSGLGILATTNRPETFGTALHPSDRPGRFHRLIEFELPDAGLRRQMIVHLVNTSTVLDPLDDITFERLVEHTNNQSGAQIAELIRELESRLLWNLQKGQPTDLNTILEDLAEESRNITGFGFGGGRFSAGVS